MSKYREPTQTYYQKTYYLMGRHDNGSHFFYVQLILSFRHATFSWYFITSYMQDNINHSENELLLYSNESCLLA